MSNLPNIVPNNNPDSHWASRVNSSIRQNETVNSPDFYVRRTGAGTTLTLKHKHKIQPPSFPYITEFNPDSAYDVGQEVNCSTGSYTTMTGTHVTASLGHWRCVAPVPSTYYAASLTAASAASGVPVSSTEISFYTRSLNVNYAPVYPVPAQTANAANPFGAYWHLVAGTGSAAQTSSMQRFVVKSVSGDYLTCRTWDGTTSGSTDVAVAKPPALRHSITGQIVDGVPWTYTYGTLAGNFDGYRQVSSGSYTEYHEVIPVYMTGSPSGSVSPTAEIWGIQPQGGTGVGSAPTWLDLNVSARAWCQYA